MRGNGTAQKFQQRKLKHWGTNLRLLGWTTRKASANVCKFGIGQDRLAKEAVGNTNC